MAMDITTKIRIMFRRLNRNHIRESYLGGLIIAAIMICLSVTTGYAQSGSNSPIFRPDMQALGMGGAYVAAGDNANALVYNPALLSRAGFDLVISSLRFRLDNDFLNVANFVMDHQKDFALYDTLYSGQVDSTSIGGLDEFLEDITPYENRWGKTRFAPMFRLSFDNFGFGIYNSTDIWIKADKGIYNPRVYGWAISDLVFLAGYAQEVNQKVTVGFTGKFVSRRTSDLVRIESTDLDATNEVLKPAYNHLKKDDRGGGLDLGALYAYRPNVDFGCVLQDAVGWIGSKRISRNLKVGVAYHWKGFPFPSISKGLIAADIEDLLFTTGDHFFKRIHFGASSTFLVFNARVGFNQGYPSTGIGLNLYIFSIDYAYYGEELSQIPGQEEEWYHTLELTIGL